MKKKHYLAIALMLVLSLSMMMPAFASAYTPYASDQITDYSIAATPTSGGKIAIKFSVFAPAKMSVIGAKSITVYEKSGSAWIFAGAYSKDNIGMTRTDAYNCGNTITYQGVAGRQYRVDVTVFAEDNTGASDSRSRSFLVTAQ